MDYMSIGLNIQKILCFALHYSLTANSSLKAAIVRGHEILARKDARDNSYYYLNNAHGDVVGLADAAGNVVNSYKYDAFGNIVEVKEQILNRFRYAGEQFDQVTGQYYLRARFYNPVIGRFTQEDTYRSDELNLYAYVKNNPVKYIDPSGYCGESKRGMQKTEEPDTIVVNEVNKLKLSDKARALYRRGKYSEAMDVHYEDLVRNVTGGKSMDVENNGIIREINSVTDTEVIQAKRSITAINKPKNFLSKSTRNQIKATVEYANQVGKTPEYWFKYGVSKEVQDYLESKGIRVIIGLGGV